jgi:hypothetical protein
MVFTSNQRNNSLDDTDVAEFKSTALAWHETYNGRLKSYAILRETFCGRQQLEKHGLLFPAVAVICQLEMIHLSPLFNM